MDIQAFFRAVLDQDAEALRLFFHPEAQIRWHCTNEQFTVNEYIRANCEYPGDWAGELERVDQAGDVTITAARVYPRDRSAFFHVVSYLRVADGKITALDEYWADDGEAPEWRGKMKIGRPIR